MKVKQLLLRMILTNSWLLVLFVLVIGCGNKKSNSILYYLTNNSIKRWDMLQPNPMQSHSGIIFNTNGFYKRWFFNADGDAVERILYYSPTWELINDSILKYGVGVSFKIEYINDEVLILNNLNIKEIVVYVRSKNQNAEMSKEVQNEDYPPY